MPKENCTNISVSLHSAQLKRQMDRQQDSLSRLTQQINVISQWQNTTLHHLVHHVHLLNLPVLLNSPIEPKVKSWLKVIQALHQTTKQECEEQMEKVKYCMSSPDWTHYLLPERENLAFKVLIIEPSGNHKYWQIKICKKKISFFIMPFWSRKAWQKS